jgi:hypothetical protein
MEVQSEHAAYSQTSNLGVRIPAHDATRGSNSCQRKLAHYHAMRWLLLFLANSLSRNSLSKRLPLGADHCYGV